MTSRLTRSLLAMAGLFLSSAALWAQTIGDFEVTKIQDFQQSSSSTPVSHSILGSPNGAFNFAALMFGDSFDQFTSMPTVTLPNSTVQTALDLDPGYYDDYGVRGDYSSKTAMDAAYPNGNYKFSFPVLGTLGQQSTQTVTIPLGATDGYPAEIPRVTNGTWDNQGNLVINSAADTTLNFNTFSGYTTGVGGLISFDIYGLSGTTLVSNPVDASSVSVTGLGTDPALTSFTITANTLQPNQIYYVELAFIHIVTVNQPYKQALALPAFDNVTGFMLSTYLPATSPSITQQPVSQTIAAGGTVTFTASANGTPTPTFQWQKNNVDINGATSSSYSISNITPTDAGGYRVVATNSAGSAISNTATLTVPAVRADFNGDGKADLIWENTVTGDRYLWLMNDTAYASSINLGAIGSQWHVAGTGDFNGDGKADLIWENTSTGERYIWLMNGTTFASSVFLGVMPVEWQIAGAADFNNDGNTDIVWQNSSTGERYLWLMNGTSFSSSVFLGVMPVAWQIAGAADFNGDGKADLIWENTSTGERYLWLMNGTSYSASVFLGVISTDWRIAGAADFNRDGKTDLVWQNNATGERYLWLMSGTSFSSAVSLGVVAAQWQISL